MADAQILAAALSVDKSVLVIGAGTMGCGIAEVAASAGHRVYLRDTSTAALDRGLQQIHASLDKRVARGKLDAATRDAVLARIEAVAPGVGLRDVGLVIEVIVEKLDIKATVLKQVEAEVAPDTIIASNTSSLSITAVAGKLARPERVVGMHFFNPATILPLVEVVSGHATDPAVAQAIVATAKAWGKSPVACRSTPGFIVNRVARPFYGEGLRVLLEQAATPATLDAVMRESGGFKMGPCELMDLIGHDVNHAVTQSVWHAFFDDPRYRPSLIQQDLVDAGWLGRKSGRGFFDYRPDAESPQVDQVTLFGPPPSRVEHGRGASPALNALLEDQGELTIEHRDGDICRVDGFAFAVTDGRTAAERSAEAGEPVVLVDLALDYAACTRIAIAAPACATAAHVDRVAALFAKLGKRVTLIGDTPGMAVARTVAMLVNEAADAVLQGVASEADVDAAMIKGVNYPLGPMAWGRRVGFGFVARLLRHLALAYGEDRYRVSLWLQREVHGAVHG